MGGCTSKTAARPGSTSKRSVSKRSDDELTQADLERLNAERQQRQTEEDELTRMIYAEKAALREITSKMIVKKASCESLMDLLDPEELEDISLNEASFRAQKQARRKLMKRLMAGKRHDWLVRTI
jgi:septal ring factor EnvC (AmiA/AmiB activator)